MSVEERDQFCHNKYQDLHYTDPGHGELELCYDLCAPKHLHSYFHNCQLYCPDYWQCLNTTFPATTEPVTTAPTSFNPVFVYRTIIAVLSFLALLLVIFVAVLLCKSRLRKAKHHRPFISHPTQVTGLSTAAQEEDVLLTETGERGIDEESRLSEARPSTIDATVLTRPPLDPIELRPFSAHFQPRPPSVLVAPRPASAIDEARTSLPGVEIKPSLAPSITDSNQNPDTGDGGSQRERTYIQTRKPRTPPVTERKVLYSSSDEDREQRSEKDAPLPKVTSPVPETALVKPKFSPLGKDLELQGPTSFPAQCSENHDAPLSMVSHSGDGGPLSLNLQPIGHPSDSFLHADQPSEQDDTPRKRTSPLSFDHKKDRYMNSLVAQESFSPQSPFSLTADEEDGVLLNQRRKRTIVALLESVEWIVAVSFTSTAIEVLVDIPEARQRVIDLLKLHDVQEKVHVIEVTDVEFEHLADHGVGTVITGPGTTFQCSIGFFVRYRGMLHCVSTCHGSLNPGDHVSGDRIFGTCKAAVYTSQPATCDASLIQLEQPYLHGRNIVPDSADQEYKLEMYTGVKRSLEQTLCSKFEQKFQKNTGKVTSTEYFFYDRKKNKKVWNCIAVENLAGSDRPFCVKGDCGKVVAITPAVEKCALGIGVIFGHLQCKVASETGGPKSHAVTFLTPMKRVMKSLEESSYCRGETLHLEPRRIPAPLHQYPSTEESGYEVD